MLTTLALLLAVSPLNNGPCLDSAVAVPHPLNGTGKGAETVRIDKVVATSTFIDGEIIGYLYTRQDGNTFLGQRKSDYMSGADSRAINVVFASTHLPDATVTQFPPERKFGVKTNYQQEFQVKLPSGALDPLHIRLDPCVAWPGGQPLPNPIP
ncbi:MAG: hypothetical protein M3R35_04140 [Candidatus Eremiobacteraeota bacterium]|nr:hypothetical protein [Candidatus Eremiobacteraeota bacterium]